MEPFIRSEQFNFIKYQTQILMNGYTSVNDKTVLTALKSLVIERVFNLFPDMSEEQLQLLNPLNDIRDSDRLEKYLSQLKHFVIPFKEVSEQSIKKLFPKAKKIKIPLLKKMDLTEMSYIGWDDLGSNSKFIVTYYGGKLIGLQGTFKPLHKKGNCAICNKFDDLGMFMTKTKGKIEGTYIQRGNYICRDSQKCNQNLISLDKMNVFISIVKS